MSGIHVILRFLRIPCPLCAIEVWLWHRELRKKLASVDLDDESLWGPPAPEGRDAILEWLRKTSVPVSDTEDAVK